MPHRHWPSSPTPPRPPLSFHNLYDVVKVAAARKTAEAEEASERVAAAKRRAHAKAAKAAEEKEAARHDAKVSPVPFSKVPG